MLDKSENYFKIEIEEKGATITIRGLKKDLSKLVAEVLQKHPTLYKILSKSIKEYKKINKKQK